MPVVRLSRYEFARVEVDSHDRIFLDVPDPLPRVTRSSDLRGIAGETDTLFGFAWKAYKDLLDQEQDIRPTSFWDVIAETNNLIDAIPVLERGILTLEPGLEIRVPDIESLMGEIRIPPLFYDGADENTVTP